MVPFLRGTGVRDPTSLPPGGVTLELLAKLVVKGFVELDVRVVIAALVLLTICLAVGYVRIAASIHKEHKARFSRIQQRLEQDATALVDRLLHRD
jgi:hypothetical protein